MHHILRNAFTALLLLAGALSFHASAQVSVTATAGTPGPTSYTTLKGAFDAINLGTHQGAITISITAGTTETATAVLNASGGTSSYTAVTIKPAAATTPTITGNLATQIIKLNGADNVTIDGSNTAGGTTRDLTISNTNTGATTTADVWIASASASDGATGNTVKNCVFTGNASTTTVAGIIAGSGATLGNAAQAANSNNTIQNNLFTKAQNGVYIYGVATYDQNWLITQNVFGSTSVTADKLGFRGVLVGNTQNLVVSSNSLLGLATTVGTYLFGIHLAFGQNGALVYNNTVGNIYNSTAGGYGAAGIYLAASTTASNVKVYNNFVYDVTGLGYNGFTIGDNGYGIAVDAGGGYGIYYNSVSISSNATVAANRGAAMFVSALVTTANSVDLRDNIFANFQTFGNANSRFAILSTAANTVYSNINYNDYYSTSGNLSCKGSNATITTTLAALQTSLGSNTNSKAIAPVYTSASDLHLVPASNTTLNNLGTPITGLTTDIDGTTRSATTPDMGADEFTPATDDAGITAVAGVCPGVSNVNVTIKNYGVATLNTVSVTWSVNGVPQGTVPFTGLGIAPGGTSVQTLGAYSFAANTSYSFVASTSLPNGNPDANTANDALSTTISPGLSGTYTVGSGGNFATLTAAAAAYNSYGLCGAVVFSLTDANYTAGTGETFPVTFNSITTSGSGNTLTIKPAAGVSPTITTSTAAAAIKFFGADYCIIDGSNAVGGTSRNLTISNTASGTTVAVWIGSAGSTDAATNDVVRNCNFSGLSNATTIAGVLSGSGITMGNLAEAPNSNNTIQNNLFTKMQNGLFVYGAAAMDANWLITKNYCGSATVAGDKMGFRGMFIYNAQNAAITSDTVIGVNTSTATFITGIQAGGILSGGKISECVIREIASTTPGGYGAEGLYLAASSTASNFTVANNFIKDVYAVGYASGTTFTDNGYGLLADAGGGYKIYHNTINLAVNQSGGTGVSAAINIATPTVGAVDLRNNIIETSQTGGGSRYGLYSSVANTVFSNINYNDYYAASGTPGFIGSARNNLSQIQTGFGGNANSLNTAPVFVSATDLHLQTDANCALDAAGTPIAAVTTDIDAQARNASNPDLGADEFTSTFSVNAGIDQSLCAPGSFSLSGSGIPTGGTGLWTVVTGSGTFTPNNAAASTVSGFATAGATNTYNWAVVSGSCGANDNLDVLAYDIPFISTNPADVSICAGSPFSLGVSASAAGGYQWYQGATPVGTGNPYSVGSAAVSDAGSYHVDVSGLGACSVYTVSSGNAAVVVNAGGQWLGLSNDWNSSGNWCGGTPTITTDVLVPAVGGSVLFAPHVLSGNTANVHNIDLLSGDVTVDAGGTLNLDANITLSPAGTFTATGGTVNFTGSSAQNILPGFIVGTMSIGGGSTKTLNGDVSVSSSLVFTNGMLDVGTNALTLFPGGTITGASSARYVKTSGANGRLIREVSSLPVDFPVGNSAYNPATITNTGTTDNFSVHVRDQVLTAGTGGTQVTAQAVDRSWDISEQVDGGSIADITLQWNAERDINSFNYSHDYIAHYTGGAWINTCCPLAILAPAANTVSPGVYSVSTTGITSFSPFAVSSSGPAPLPVVLLKLDAANEGARNKVEWTSASEDKLARYVVERSADGVTFSHMADVAAAGRAYGYITYDNAPETGFTYYRLKMVDYNGAESYSPVVKAFLQRSGDVAVSALPNPLQDQLYVSVYGAAGGDVVMTDISGQVVAHASVANGQAVIPTNALAAGTYFVKYTNGAATKVVKVTKQ